MFMGDEWGAREPFPFFCDFKARLAEAVRNGRRKEFAAAYADGQADVPDPLSVGAMRMAKLDWAAIERPSHRARTFDLRAPPARAARKIFITPRLPRLRPGHGQAEFTGGVLTARWRFGTRETLTLLANLGGGGPEARPDSFKQGEPVWGGEAPAQLPPWSVYAAIGAA